MARVVRPGSVVLDVGAGAGILSLLAARMGARKVYAVEPADAVELGRTLAQANRLADRIEFLQARSQDVRLAERADVLVWDLRGTLPFHGDHVAAVIDARERLLAAGASLVAARDRVSVAPVQAAVAYRRLVGGWDGTRFGLDLADGAQRAAHNWTAGQFDAGHLLAEPAVWAEIDYATVSATGAGGTLAWTLDREADLHGFLAWFDSFGAAGDVLFSNRPSDEDTLYGRAFFPLPAPVHVVRGARVELSLRADRVGSDYVWSWQGAVEDRAGGRQAFRQSTFGGATLTRDTLRRRSADHVPTPNAEGEVERFVLGQMDGRRTSRQIAAALHAQFPGRFADERQALDHVTDLAVRLSR